MDIYQKCPECGAFAYGLSYYSNGHYCFPRHGGCGRDFLVEISMVNGLFFYTIPKRDNLLEKSTTAFFHDYYIRPKDGGGKFSTLILGIKYNGTEDIKNSIAKIVGNDLDKIFCANKQYLKSRPIVVAVPMLKPENFWKDCALQFRSVVSIGLGKSKCIIKRRNDRWMIDGTQYLIRTLPTQTTYRAHLNEAENIGSAPYPE